jgi:CRISPR system Cascade subunit CasA
MNLLEDRLIRTDCGEHSLPEILATLYRDEIRNFPALRHHQVPVWHAFLVQVSVLAIEATTSAEPPSDAAGWRSALRGLTPDWPDDEPWRLVTRADCPAFLQPPIPGSNLAPFKTRVDFADELDILVTSKNHDVKAERLANARPDDWIFALVSLQTQEGQMGRGNYGIARMNGGYGSRPFLGIAPEGGPGARFRRDLQVLLRPTNRRFGPAWGSRRQLKLVWLEPWDGKQQLQVDELHPFFIEVCRRVRLMREDNGRLFARLANSEAARISAKELKGVTDDPWAPVEVVPETKLFSLTAEGFSWRKMRELLFSGTDQGSKRVFKRPLLAVLQQEDRDSAAVEIVAAGLARGQGKTEGFHERRIPIPPHARARLEDETDRTLVDAADRQERDAGTMAQRVLRPALLCAFEKGPEQLNFNAREAAAATEAFTKEFDAAVDADFFTALWGSLDKNPEEAERAWQTILQNHARETLRKALTAGPRTEARRFIAAARAESLFAGSLYRQFPMLRRSADQSSDHNSPEGNGDGSGAQ